MIFHSTKNNSICVSSAEAIVSGLAPDGGLYVPESIPSLDMSIEDFAKLSYPERAKTVLSKFLTDFTEEELNHCVNSAYIGNFDNDCPAPVKTIDDGTHFLELWHGPTCAFKDMALQILPYLLTTSVKKTGKDSKTVILVATSGDTGKAALEGFKDVEGTSIIVFYPNNGVSPMQKLQMDTQKGNNVYVSAINGNFDDAQTGVKRIFNSADAVKRLADKNMSFSSANSINWGRLVPQIVYYFSACADLVAKGTDVSEGINFCVPTGNFGNILAAYYAKLMGAPINKLICASNSNNVLTDFISSGVYNRNRPFKTTISPSMDILISSNLERLVYHLCGGDSTFVSAIQKDLAICGRYDITNAMQNEMRSHFWGGFCDDAATMKTIGETYEKFGYLIDTHTAVALSVYRDYVNSTGDNRPTVVVSTASPFKFSNSVLKSIGGEVSQDEAESVKILSETTGIAIPSPIASVMESEPRFNNVCSKNMMFESVCNYLEI